jgi:putative SOS response-associated peptidase YedK
MCGRLVQTLPPEAMARVFRATGPLPNHGPSWNVAPTQGALVVRNHGGARALDVLRWGLVPYWAKDIKIGARAINARSEDAARSPMFREALQRRRCLVPADAFYEWQVGAHGAPDAAQHAPDVTDGALPATPAEPDLLAAAGVAPAVPQGAKASRRAAKPKPPPKQPWAIARADGQPLALAGLWERWKSREGSETVQSFTILTCAPNAAMAALHDRMPVVLGEADWPAWLGEEDGAGALALLKPCPAEWLTTWRVSARVNRHENNDPGLLERVA